MKQTYELAGLCVELDTLYADAHTLCADYQTDKPAQFRVVTREADIAVEQETFAAQNEPPLAAFTPGYLETLAVYRKFAEAIIPFNRLLFHASVVVVDGVAYAFTAKSGTGKSTHTRLWRQVFGERAVMLNDDKPILEVTDSGVIAHGTPWDGKHRLSHNITAPLGGIAILTRDTVNHIVPASPLKAYKALLEQCYRPVQNGEAWLSLLEQVLKTTPVYALGCNMTPHAAEVAYHGMNNQNH